MYRFGKTDQYLFGVAAAIGTGAAKLPIIGNGDAHSGVNTIVCHAFSGSSCTYYKHIKFFYGHTLKINNETGYLCYGNGKVAR